MLVQTEQTDLFLYRSVFVIEDLRFISQPDFATWRRKKSHHQRCIITKVLTKSPGIFKSMSPSKSRLGDHVNADSFLVTGLNGTASFPDMTMEYG
jgi:hypothetical protein